MEKLTMCRVCLGEDIRRVSIVGTHLQEMYESLVLMPFETEDNRPILVCYICRTRLKNCYELKKKCLQSEEMFKQMLSCNKYGQVKLQAINNKTSGVGQILGMDADNVGVEFLECKVKEEPKDDEDVSEDVLEENSISDDMLLSAYSDSGNKKNTFNVLEMDAHSVSVEALKCKVKEEPNDDQDVEEDVLEENSVSDDMLLSAYSSRNERNMFHVLEMNSDNDGLAALKCEVEYEPNDDEASESKKQINEEKVKNSAKMNDDELILRRKKRNAERARAYRKRKKDLDAMPSTSTVKSGEPVSENIVAAKLLHQKKLNMERCRRYRLKCKRQKSGANFNRDTSESNTSTSRE